MDGVLVALTGRGRLAATLTVLAVTVLVAAYVVRGPLGTTLGLPTAPDCTLAAGDERVEWSRTDAMTATTVTGVGLRIGASVNGVAAAVDRSLAADRDVALSPTASRAVYRRLPDRARPGPEAVKVAEALMGYDGPALTCALGLDDAFFSSLPAQGLGRTGLTPRAETVRRSMQAAYGQQSLGGFAVGGVSGGHIEGSAHYEGRAIDVFFRPVASATNARGWAQAQWAVAHAERLHLATVIFDRRIWSAARSASGWRDYRYPGGETDNPVLLHEDHVHLDVIEGG